MKIAFHEISDYAILETILHSHFVIGEFNVQDVQNLLAEQEIACTSLLGKSDISDFHVKDQIHQPYDMAICCRVAAPPYIEFFLFRTKLEWAIRFHFENNVLVEILINKSEPNPL